jgi:Fic family protein
LQKYIHQYSSWPNFTWKDSDISKVFGEVRHLQGKIHAQMNTLGFSIKSETALSTLTLDIVKSSEIEGEKLNYKQVRSSIARNLGLNVAGLTGTNRDIEGIVTMMLDATQNNHEILTEERIFFWHASLFPMGKSGLYNINIGTYRNDEMQIVSGALGKKNTLSSSISNPCNK